MLLFDAHNHLQDPRLAPRLDAVLADCQRVGIDRMVVNGSREEDWPRVLALAQRYPLVLPSFGFHPWYVRQRTDGWLDNLKRCLDTVPSAVGEIGLDRWIEKPDVPLQEEMFRVQLQFAAERGLPVSIHCLKAWGRLDAMLREVPRPACGFLLHSYNGPGEMIPGFVKLGAYFSLSGYFAHERKTKQRDAFRQVPRERLLLETDAPDMGLPDEWNDFPLQDSATGRPVNHPANLGAIYRFAARLLEVDPELLRDQVAQNFSRLFGAVGS